MIMKHSKSEAHLLDANSQFRAYLCSSATFSLTAVTSLSAAVVDDFQDPYQIPTNTNLSGEINVVGGIGDWAGSLSGTGSLASITLTSPNSTPTPSFSFGMTATTGSANNARIYEFLTTASVAEGTDQIKFTISGVTQSGDSPAGVFLRNGASQGSILANGNYDFTVSPNDTFGFRFSATYSGFSGLSDNLALTVSNFQAVPEPAATATWMGAGALGMVAIRELRRRRNQRSKQTSKG